MGSSTTVATASPRAPECGWTCSRPFPGTAPTRCAISCFATVGFANDGNFTWERFDERYTADLADGLGNLASRSLAMLEKYRGGIVPADSTTSLDASGEGAVRAYAEAMEALDLRAGAEAAWGLVTMANQYIVQTAPWALAKQGREPELDHALGGAGPLSDPPGGPGLPLHAGQGGGTLEAPRAGCLAGWRMAAGRAPCGHRTTGEEA